VDLRQIKNLMKEFEDSKIHKLEINDKDFGIKLEKEDNKIFSASPSISQVAQMPLASQVAEAATDEVVEELCKYTEICAPLVGTFYMSPSPDSEPFVSVGSRVNKGDVLFIVEAMKVMNEITAAVSGIVKSINVNDGIMVEFGQVVMEIEE